MSSPSEWIEFDETRIVQELDHDIFVIKPKKQAFHIPLFCPICNIVMDSRLDAIIYKKFECCEPCANDWAYLNSTRWNDSWRPSPEEVSTIIKTRKPRSISIKAR
jgi:hypothetical protein